jgi:hypothetical protein
MSCTLTAEQLETVRTNPGNCPHLKALADSRRDFFNANERLARLEAPADPSRPPVANLDDQLAAARNAVRAATYLYEQAQETAKAARPDVFGAAPELSAK